MVELSRGQLEDFRNGALWEDIRKELSMRIDNLHSVMESEQATIEDIYRCQGGIKAFREVCDNLLDFLIEASAERKENNE